MDARDTCEIKGIIELIVSTSPCNLTIEQLNQKYYSVKSENVPYKQLGHESLELFLRSMPTTLRLGGTGSTAVVINAVNCKSDCMKDFVKLKNNNNDNQSIAKTLADNRILANYVPHNGINLLRIPMPNAGYQQPIRSQFPAQYFNLMLLKEANRITSHLAKQTVSQNCRGLMPVSHNFQQIVKNVPSTSQQQQQQTSAMSQDSFASAPYTPLTNYIEAVVHLGFKIATRELPERGSIFPLCINSITTPHKFYFSIHSKQNELELLKCNMNNFYSAVHEDQYKIPLQCLMLELYCAVFICGNWLRAQIIEPIDECNFIKVKAIDIEIITKVTYSNAKFLLRRFTKWPAQALCGSLSYLQPSNGYSWSADARKCFQQLASERQLYGQVAANDHVKKITHLILWDASSGSSRRQINTTLIFLGMAKFSAHIQTS